MDPVLLGLALAALALPLSQLALPEVRRDGTSAWIGLGAWGALLLALVLPPFPAVAAVIVEMFLCGLLAVRALDRALRRTRLRAAELGLALAWAWALGGGVWLLVGASDGSLLGFRGTWAWLTAAHFHAAGFAAVSLTALLVRATGRGAWLLAAHPVAFGLIAAGITGSHRLEQLGTLAYLALFGAQFLMALRSGLHRRRGGVLALVALGLPLLTLMLAADWSMGARRLDLAGMAWLHGLTNAGGHGILGLLAFGLMAPEAAAPPVQARFSRARAPGRVGQAFLETLRPARDTGPTGLLDDFSRFAGPELDPEGLDPRIAHFYEHTAAWDIEARQAWQPGFRLGGALFHALGRRMGQLGLPGPDTPAGAMTNRIADVDDARDGREGVRAWIRTWKATGETLYVALYSEHLRDGRRWMNIAFPLPHGCMTSLLHLRREGDTLALTTLGRDGEQGVYLQLGPLGPWRTPLDETITVRAEAAGLSAVHDMWVFGRLFLRLDYGMRLQEGPSVSAE